MDSSLLLNRFASSASLDHGQRSIGATNPSNRPSTAHVQRSVTQDHSDGNEDEARGRTRQIFSAKDYSATATVRRSIERARETLRRTRIMKQRVKQLELEEQERKEQVLKQRRKQYNLQLTLFQNQMRALSNESRAVSASTRSSKSSLRRRTSARSMASNACDNDMALMAKMASDPSLATARWHAAYHTDFVRRDSWMRGSFIDDDHAFQPIKTKSDEELSSSGQVSEDDTARTVLSVATNRSTRKVSKTTKTAIHVLNDFVDGKRVRIVKATAVEILPKDTNSNIESADSKVSLASSFYIPPLASTLDDSYDKSTSKTNAALRSYKIADDCDVVYPRRQSSAVTAQATGFEPYQLIDPILSQIRDESETSESQELNQLHLKAKSRKSLLEKRVYADDNDESGSAEDADDMGADDLRASYALVKLVGLPTKLGGRDPREQTRSHLVLSKKADLGERKFQSENIIGNDTAYMEEVYKATQRGDHGTPWPSYARIVAQDTMASTGASDDEFDTYLGSDMNDDASSLNDDDDDESSSFIGPENSNGTFDIPPPELAQEHSLPRNSTGEFLSPNQRLRPKSSFRRKSVASTKSAASGTNVVEQSSTQVPQSIPTVHVTDDRELSQNTNNSMFDSLIERRRPSSVRFGSDSDKMNEIVIQESRRETTEEVTNEKNEEKFAIEESNEMETQKSKNNLRISIPKMPSRKNSAIFKPIGYGESKAQEQQTMPTLVKRNRAKIHSAPADRFSSVGDSSWHRPPSSIPSAPLSPQRPTTSPTRTTARSEKRTSTTNSDTLEKKDANNENNVIYHPPVSHHLRITNLDPEFTLFQRRVGSARHRAAQKAQTHDLDKNALAFFVHTESLCQMPNSTMDDIATGIAKYEYQQQAVRASSATSSRPRTAATYRSSHNLHQPTNNVITAPLNDNLPSLRPNSTIRQVTKSPISGNNIATSAELLAGEDENDQHDVTSHSFRKSPLAQKATWLYESNMSLLKASSRRQSTVQLKRRLSSKILDEDSLSRALANAKSRDDTTFNDTVRYMDSILQ